MSAIDPRDVANSLRSITVDCRRPDKPQIEFVTCEKCTQRYAVHCSDCNSQITGCRCTLELQEDIDAEG